MLVQYSTRYEVFPFNTGGGGTSSDYAFMLVFGATALHIINLYMGSYVMGSSLVSMITYVWSCREPHSLVSFWGFTLQAMYLPWALAALSFLMSGTDGLITPLLGTWLCRKEDEETVVAGRCGAIPPSLCLCTHPRLFSFILL